MLNQEQKITYTFSPSADKSRWSSALEFLKQHFEKHRDEIEKVVKEVNPSVAENGK